MGRSRFHYNCKFDILYRGIIFLEDCCFADVTLDTRAIYSISILSLDKKFHFKDDSVEKD